MTSFVKEYSYATSFVKECLCVLKLMIVFESQKMKLSLMRLQFPLLTRL